MRCRRRRWAGRQRYRISADADLAGPQGGEAEHEDHPLVEDLRERRSGVVLVTGMLPREDVRQVLTHATVFCCPSIYEPQGIVNLEAMACQTPVVASDVGGIPDVVTDGETGLLVHYDPADPAGYQQDLATSIDHVVNHPTLAQAMGRAGRHRAHTDFAWSDVAARTAQLYHQLHR